MDIQKVVKKCGRELLLKQNVVMVGPGTKIVGGVDTGRPAVVVGVSKKVPWNTLAVEDIIPRSIGGEETDVVEVGEINLLAGLDRKARWRPAPPGVSIGHYEITAGTLGRYVIKNGVIYGLSNNHVFARQNQAAIGDPIWQPGKVDGGSPEDVLMLLHEFVELSIGQLSDCTFSTLLTRVANAVYKLLGSDTRFQAIRITANKVDCAIAKPLNNSDIDLKVLEVGIIRGDREPSIGMEVKKSARSSGLTYDKITQLGVMANVGLGDGKFALFEDQIASPIKCEPGDSGSVILTIDNYCVGLLFAGSDTITLANKYSNVKKALKLD